MNISELIASTPNLTGDRLLITSICNRMTVTLDYNSWIMTNMFLTLLALLNWRFDLSERLVCLNGDTTLITRFTTEKTSTLFIIILAMYNVCMFVFQFVAFPLFKMLGG